MPIDAAPTRRRFTGRSFSPREARVYLADPNRVGNREEVLRALVGCMTVEEADALEARINAMNERLEEPPNGAAQA